MPELVHALQYVGSLVSGVAVFAGALYGLIWLGQVAWQFVIEADPEP